MQMTAKKTQTITNKQTKSPKIPLHNLPVQCLTSTRLGFVSLYCIGNCLPCRCLGENMLPFRHCRFYFSFLFLNLINSNEISLLQRRFAFANTVRQISMKCDLGQIRSPRLFPPSGSLNLICNFCTVSVTSILWTRLSDGPQIKAVLFQVYRSNKGPEKETILRDKEISRL